MASVFALTVLLLHNPHISPAAAAPPESATSASSVLNQQPLVPGKDGKCSAGFELTATEGAGAEPPKVTCRPTSLKAAQYGAEEVVSRSQQRASAAAARALQRTRTSLSQTEDIGNDASVKQDTKQLPANVVTGTTSPLEGGKGAEGGKGGEGTKGVAESPEQARDSALKEGARIRDAAVQLRKETVRKLNDATKRAAESEQQQRMRVVEQDLIQRAEGARKEAEKEERRRQRAATLREQEAEAGRLRKAQEEELKKTIDLGLNPPTSTLPSTAKELRAQPAPPKQDP